MDDNRRTLLQFSKLGRQHRKAAVAAAIGPFFMSLLYSLSNPWLMWLICEGWPQHRGLHPLLFLNSGLGSFSSHKI